MAFSDDQIGIGKTPFARPARRGERKRRRLSYPVVKAAETPPLWPITQNVNQGNAGNVNRLNMRDPLTAPSQDAGRGRVIGHGGENGVTDSFIFGNGPTSDNGNG